MPHPTRSSVRTAILDTSNQNSMLLVRLRATSSAPSQLSAHETYLTALRAALAEQDAEAARLEAVLAQASRAQRRSALLAPARKLLARATQRVAAFEARGAEVRRVVEGAAAARDSAEERCAALRSALQDAEREERRLRDRVAEHEGVHGQIDDLYERVFAGPTPGFEGEDERELRFNEARRAHEVVKTRISEARVAGRLLGVAERRLKKAIGFIGSARDDAGRSRLSFDGALYSLRVAGEHCARASIDIGSATRVLTSMDEEMKTKRSWALEALLRAKAETEPLFSRDKIISSVNAMEIAVTEAMDMVVEMRELMKHNENDGIVKLKDTARTLEESRQVLQEVRQGIFEEVAGFGEAAPAYTECCDRADTFCILPAYPYDEVDELPDEQNGEQQVQETLRLSSS